MMKKMLEQIILEAKLLDHQSLKYHRQQQLKQAAINLLYFKLLEFEINIFSSLNQWFSTGLASGPTITPK